MTPKPMACLRSEDGSVIPLDVTSWSARADATELRQLAALRGPVLDIGCGPGRLLVALGERGVPALGIDSSPAAVLQAIDRGAVALLRSVFEAVPGDGRWATALLFDGNIGIGGDPVRLLRRTADLLARDGQLIVETAAPGTGTRLLDVRLERGHEASDWFAWAQVAVEHVGGLGEAAGLRQVDLVEDGGRWFATLARRAGR